MMNKPIKLKLIKRAEVVPTTPFDFDSIFHKPDHFTSGDNYWEPGSKWQTWEWHDKCFGLKFQNKGTVRKPKLQIDIYSDMPVDEPELNSLLSEIKYRYNLELDVTNFYQSLGNDKTLGPIIKRWKGMRPGHPSSLYEYLIIGIVLQNATVRRSVQMFRALLENYGKLLEYDGKQL